MTAATREARVCPELIWGRGSAEGVRCTPGSTDKASSATRWSSRRRFGLAALAALRTFIRAWMLNDARGPVRRWKTRPLSLKLPASLQTSRTGCERRGPTMLAKGLLPLPCMGPVAVAFALPVSMLSAG